VTRRHVQEPLFHVDVDPRHLRDDDRTVLEAIDKLGAITLRDAGRIVYRIANRRLPVDRATGFRSAGWKTIKRLRALGLVAKRHDGRWTKPHLLTGATDDCELPRRNPDTLELADRKAA
jgi:hypothetical protein